MHAVDGVHHSSPEILSHDREPIRGCLELFVELFVDVQILLLLPDNVQHFLILLVAEGALVFPLILHAGLVVRVLAEEVHRGREQLVVTEGALGDLEYGGTDLELLNALLHLPRVVHVLLDVLLVFLYALLLRLQVLADQVLHQLETGALALTQDLYHDQEGEQLLSFYVL